MQPQNPQPQRLWELLYAASISHAFAYRFKSADAVDDWLAEDALSAGMGVAERAAVKLGSDRGPINFQRWARACIETFEAELAGGTKDRAYRARLERHVDKLRRILTPEGRAALAEAILDDLEPGSAAE